jgi:hypothetical protein
MFVAHNFVSRTPLPHGQIIHVRAGSVCLEWVVLDFEHAWNPKFGGITMNWPVMGRKANMHWEWECGD